ncbi:hypothetical protein [Streptomyces hirsutus]|uniref:hypothetical protein n=1 Tax=Streptomyces hirsutus TaxID=35620 RepID=UPI0006E37DDE|nr:hypothetical protein [Streptomyces hirsutus]
MTYGGGRTRRRGARGPALRAGLPEPGSSATGTVAALALLGERIAAVESAITRAADPRRIMARPATRRAEGDL